MTAPRSVAVVYHIIVLRAVEHRIRIILCHPLNNHALSLLLCKPEAHAPQVLLGVLGREELGH